MDKEPTNPDDVINNIMVISHLNPDTSNSDSLVSVTSSDKVGVLNKSDILQLEINKEIDKLFGPALERTRSGIDIEVTAPLRQRKRQYHSQEVLSPDVSLIKNEVPGSSNGSLNILHIAEPKGIDDEKLNRVSILYDNQRAEIVASVTERLYNKLKRNEKVVSKMETMVDKKIMQPLSELKICSNARQRLVELSQKALKNKRKIGIPAFTQTKKYATRVKDQEVDVQTDLQPYANYRKNGFILQKDVGTATEPITPRYKDVAAGSKYSTINVVDQYTSTVNKKKTYKNSFTMTENVCICNRFTQTCVLPPPRRKKRTIYFPKYLKKSESLRSRITEKISSPIININISPVYPEDSESSNEQSEVSAENCTYTIADNVKEIKDNENKIFNEKLKERSIKKEIQNEVDDFSEDDGISVLPRVTQVDTSRKVNDKDYEDIILGRNGYPYNVILSPTNDIDKTKRVIQFKDIDITPAECGSAKWLEKKNESFDFSNSEDIDNYFKSSGSISIDTAELTKQKLDSHDNIRPCEKSSSLYGHLYKNSPGRITSIENLRYNENNDSIKYSLSEPELSFNAIKSARQSILLNNDLVKFESNLDKTGKSLCLPTGKQKFNELKLYKSSKYKNRNKLTPTEYLKQLIHIRREAVASNY